MNKLYFFTILFFVFALNSSCKKSIDKLPEEEQLDLVVLAMTSGVWEMTWFKEDGVGIPDFNGYEFKYYSNYTVDAKSGAGDIKQGTWSGNATAMTTSATFPSNVGNPLLKINGTWKILRNGWTFVEAEQVVGSLTKTMRLQKK